MKKTILLLVACILSLGACSKAKNNETNFDRFCKYYNDAYVNCYIENAGYLIEETTVVSKKLMAEGKRDGLNYLYADVEAEFLIPKDNLEHKLKWLVEYTFNDDFSYQYVMSYGETQANKERAYHTENVVYCFNEKRVYCCNEHYTHYVCKDCEDYKTMSERQCEIISQEYCEVPYSISCKGFEETNPHKHLFVCYKVYEE